MKIQFEVGDVVILGGPKLVVEKIEGEQITCSWLVDKSMKATFRPEDLYPTVGNSTP